MKPIAIYVVLDEAECPRYVGRTFDPSRRLLEHARKWVWVKGIRTLEWVTDGVRWQDRERYWINCYRRFALLDNIARGGGSAGPKSEESKRKFREKMVGRKLSVETRRRIVLAIANRPLERKIAIARKISEAKKGKVPNWSAEGKARTIAVLKRIGSPMAGKKHSDETKRLIGEKGKGRPPNSGSFQKGRVAPKTEEWKHKMSQIMKGRRLSESTKQKIREKRALQDMSSRRKKHSATAESQQHVS